VAGMVCEPDVKSVEETVAVLLALAGTVVVNRDSASGGGADSRAGAPEPRLTPFGVVMVSAPFVTVNVVVVERRTPLPSSRYGRMLPRGRAARS
jgi:hypothetical protein